MSFRRLMLSGVFLGMGLTVFSEETPPVPRFRVQNMDRSVDPGADFYRFAAGGWLKSNSIPADKSGWSGFEELQQRNWFLIHEILGESAKDNSAPAKSPKGEVGRFYRSVMDTNRIEKLGFTPIQKDLKKIERLGSNRDILKLLTDFHARGIDALFNESAPPDAKNSSVYLFRVAQGGLGLPDRDYYLDQKFAGQRDEYRKHITRMFTLLGEKPEEAAAHADIVLGLETE